MNIVNWAREQLPKPTVYDIMVTPKYRDILNGITDALGITRYRAAVLVQIAMEKDGYTFE